MSRIVSVDTTLCDEGIRAILARHQANLVRNASVKMRTSDGFWTIQHDYDVLRQINSTMPSLIPQDASDNLNGYTLPIRPECVATLPVLNSLFTMIESLPYEDKSIQDHSYHVIGHSVLISAQASRYSNRSLIRHWTIVGT